MAVLTTMTTQKALPIETIEQAECEVSKIFNRLKATHLGWRANIKTQAEYDNARREWLRLLVEHRLTAQEIERGLKVADTDKNPYLPSFGQFLEWCRTFDYHALGLPTKEEVYRRLNAFFAVARDCEWNFNYRSPAEYWLLRTLWEKYSHKPSSELEKAIEPLLNEAAKKVKAGFEFPAIPKRIEKKSTPTDWALLQRNVENLRRVLQGKQANGTV